LKRA
jgi:hypothetical protein